MLAAVSMTVRSTTARFRTTLRALACVCGLGVIASAGAQEKTADAATPAADCGAPASTACFFAFTPAGAGGQLHYYASRTPGAAFAAPGPAAALIAMHGHSRDGNKTFDAALLALQRAGAVDRTVVIAPVFQVATAEAAKCHTAGVPEAQAGDLQWTCASWPEGGRARNGNRLTSFAVLDALVAEVVQRWPSVKMVTIAGFSAGAQMVQHAIGFAADAPPGVALRYVVADPGTWLYFDDVRPVPMRNGLPVDWSTCQGGVGFIGDCSLQLGEPGGVCAKVNRWKYGTDSLPESLGRGAAEARARYAAADISYLEGDLDSSDARGTAYKVLDTSCAANAQGPYRLQRGLGYGLYDHTLLAPAKQRQITIVPSCAHDVSCVFPSAAARAALLGGP